MYKIQKHLTYQSNVYLGFDILKDGVVIAYALNYRSAQRKVRELKNA